jgi:hypothetical protein
VPSSHHEWTVLRRPCDAVIRRYPENRVSAGRQSEEAYTYAEAVSGAEEASMRCSMRMLKLRAKILILS